MFLGLLPLEPFVLDVLVIEISLSNSPAPALEPHLASDSIESNPFEESSTIASPIFSGVSGCGRAFGPR